MFIWTIFNVYFFSQQRQIHFVNDLRIHDLRHSFASFLINGGRSLYEVQRILGHARSHTTQRYAHLSQGSLLEAADVATKMVGDIFLPGKPNISK